MNINDMYKERLAAPPREEPAHPGPNEWASMPLTPDSPVSAVVLPLRFVTRIAPGGTVELFMARTLPGQAPEQWHFGSLYAHTDEHGVEFSDGVRIHPSSHYIGVAGSAPMPNPHTDGEAMYAAATRWNEAVKMDFWWRFTATAEQKRAYRDRCACVFYAALDAIKATYTR